MEIKVARSPMGDPKRSGGGKAPSNPCAAYPLVALKGDILTLL